MALSMMHVWIFKKIASAATHKHTFGHWENHLRKLVYGNETNDTSILDIIIYIKVHTGLCSK